MPILRNKAAQHPGTRRVPRIRAIALQGGTPGVQGADVAQDLAELGHPPVLGHGEGAEVRASSEGLCHPVRGQAVLAARGVPGSAPRRRRVGTLAALLLMSTPAFGVGEVVTDPGAYSHMVEQIKSMNEMITEARKQVETLGGIKTVMEDVKYSAEGVYGRGVGILDTIQGTADNVGDFGSSIKKATDFSDFSKDKFNKRASPYREVNVRLDGVFKDPRSKDYDFWKDKAKRENAQQQIYKDNLNQAEVTLDEMPKRLDRLGKLSDQIENTKGLKDAADLQNRFLAELLLIQQEALKMLSHIAQALAAQHYKGIQPEVAKEAVEKSAAPPPTHNAVFETAAKQGVIGISDEERNKKLDENWK
jgi:hypothetical protein